MPDPYATLAYQLDALTEELRSRGLWSSQPPSAQALASAMPFCHDTMEFHTWLQWLFIPRVQALIAVQAPLPDNCNIAPMAEVHYAQAPWDHTHLVDILRQIDQSFARAEARWQ